MAGKSRVVEPIEPIEPDFENRTLLGFVIKVPIIVREGFYCDRGAASQLQQVFCEAINNNLREPVKKAIAEGTNQFAVQAMVDEFVNNFKFGVRQGSRTRYTDPIEKEAMSIARKAVEVHIVQKLGHKLSEYSTKELTELARDLRAKNPAVDEKARRNLAEQQNFVEKAYEQEASTAA